MDEAGGERWDGARVREVVHPGYLLEREKAITKGTSMAWNRKKPAIRMKLTASDVAEIGSWVIKCESLLSSLASGSRDTEADSSVSELSAGI